MAKSHQPATDQQLLNEMNPGLPDADNSSDEEDENMATGMISTDLGVNIPDQVKDIKGKGDAKPSIWDAPIIMRIITVLMFSGTIFITCFIRMSLPIALICIFPRRHDVPGAVNETMSISNATAQVGRIVWPRGSQALVLAAISWGKLFTIFTGMLADRVNPKILLASGLAVEAVLNSLIPTFVPICYIAVMILRALIGFFEGIIQSCLCKLIVMTLKPKERIAALVMLLTGGQMAALVANPISGAFCTHCKNAIGGWPLIFYFPTILIGTWLILDLIWVTNKTTKRRHECSREILERRRRKRMDVLGVDIPWKLILKCPGFWANNFAVFCQQVPMVTVMMFLPRYIADAMHISVLNNALMSTVPIIVFLVSSLTSSQLSLFFRKKFNITDRTFSVKMADAIASIGVGVCLILVPFAGYKFNGGTLTMVSLAMLFAGIHFAGCRATMIAVAPQFAGTLAGIAFTSLELGIMLVPLAVRSMVKEGLLSEWRTVWVAAGAVSFFPVIFYSIFGVAMPQIKPKPKQLKQPIIEMQPVNKDDDYPERETLRL